MNITRKSKNVLDLYIYNVPNVVIVGCKEIHRKLQYIEKSFNLSLIIASPEDLKQAINERTIAVIVDEKEVKLVAKVYLEKLLRSYKVLPIFYLSRNIKVSSFYKSLYEKGLQGVIKWPEEANIIHDLIIESLKPHPKAIGSSKGDEKLSEMIKSHLNLNGNYKGIKVKVIDGFAFLEGSVKSLFDKHVVERESSKVLGVKKSIVSNVKIKKYKNISDREVERKIKMYIGNVLGSKKKSLSVKVKDRVVTLLGAANSHGDVLDIEKFSMKQTGVQEVERKVKYRPSLVSKNVKKAKMLEKKIKELFEGVKYISINIYGEFAEVSGTVKIKADKLLVEKYLIQVLPVKKVVNKLYVTKMT